MRLRLLIRRHALPDAAVVWAIQDGENPTISQVLEQINEVIPLESGGDWGLEDYAVEIRGSASNFECFHFQQVQNILHDDDELLIRPLLSQDLKVRKVSGRHQITSDGRHLIDGCTFGRPKPRGPIERPAIEIPPRKRRRLTYDIDTDNSLEGNPLAIEGEVHIANDQDGSRQLVLSADFEDDDMDGNEDFEPDDEEEDEELKSIIETDEYGSDSGSAFGAQEDLANILDESLKADVRKLREAFPRAPVPLCEHILRGFDGNIGKAWEALTAAFQPAQPKTVVQDSSNSHKTPLPRKLRSSVRASSKHMVPAVTNDKDVSKAAKDMEMAVDEESIALVSYFDKHGLPQGSISTEGGLSGSNKNVRFAEESPMVNVNGLVLDEDDNEEDEEDESFDDESSSTDDSDSSDGTSSDSSDNSDLIDDASFSDDDETSSSGSGSDSESEPDEISSKPSDLPISGGNSHGTSPRNTKADQKPTVPPGQGKKRTQSRNQRRRNANLLQRLKNKGILPAGTTITEFNRLDLNKIETPEDALEELAKSKAGTFREKRRTAEKVQTAEFELRKQQLLAAIASGGVEVSLDSLSGGPVPHTPSSVSNNAQIVETTVVPALTETDTSFPLETVPNTSADPDRMSAEIVFDSTSISPVVVVEPGTESPKMSEGSATPGTMSRPRKKLDLGAAGRLLFGALGVRPPKSKADHEKVRNDLAKDVRQIKSMPRADAVIEERDCTNQDADPEAWREVITLRAVECCHDGIELSPAPFPFVQRWDVQQQGSLLKRSNRNGKGKKNQRNQPQYYDEELQVPKKNRRRYNDAFQDTNEENLSRDMEQNKDRVQQFDETDGLPHNQLSIQNLGSDPIGDAANDQIMRDAQEAALSQGVEEDDLPILPEDISLLPHLIEGNMKIGMVIAFKQLILSEKTNWQPQMSGYRTAVVIKSFENGELELTLAKRDRDEKQYDEETGERIWGKFDLPADDVEDDEGDDGFLSVALNELVEPKIVQQAPEAFSQTITTEAPQTQGKAIDSIGDPATLGFEDSPSTSKEFVEMPKNNEGKTSSPHSVPHDDSDSLSIRGGELSADDADKILAMSISEDTREEISELIREAGFRSSVPPSVLGAGSALPTASKPYSLDGSCSPKFNGFGSSQPIEAISSPSHFTDPTPPSEKPVNDNKSSSQDPETAQKLSKVNYSQIQAPPPLNSHSQVSDRGRQPDFPTPGDDTLHQFDDMDSFLGHHGDTRVGENEHVVSGQPVRSSIPKIKTGPLGAPSEISSSSSVDFPTLDEIFSTARSSVVPKKEMTPWRSTESNLEAERIADSYNKAMEALDADLDAVEDAGLASVEDHEPLTSAASQQTRRKEAPILAAEETPESTPRKTALRRTASQKTKSPKRSSSFMIPPGSQQVDLTISSDVEVEMATEKENGGDESYDDDLGLPTGPCWVEKPTRKIRRQSNTTSRRSSQMTSKTKSPRRKTTTRF